MSECRTRAYRDGTMVAEGFPVAAVSDYLEEADTIVWVDFLQPSKDELHELAGELGLHELAVEDALEPHQRPKLDHYTSHRFLSCHAVRIDEAQGELTKTEIDTFIQKRWLITVRKEDGFAMDPVLERWDRSGELTKYGVSFMLYVLLDIVVDGYFDAVQVFDDFYDRISESIFSEQPLEPAEQRQWFEMRRALVRFHRLVVPMRELVSALMRREQAVLPDEVYPYYQDVYDHILRVSESTDSLRDLVSTIVETNLSLRDYRQNQIVKKVSSWAAIGLVPTFVTGYYGMNVPFPGFGKHSGVITSITLMVSLSLILYAIFRKNDWL
jgi:magnesium transporter